MLASKINTSNVLQNIKNARTRIERADIFAVQSLYTVRRPHLRLKPKSANQLYSNAVDSLCFRECVDLFSCNLRTK